MCSVTHVAAGAVIGILVDSRLAAFLIGFVSHIPLDAVPHIDFKDYRIDGVLTVGLLVGIFAFTGLTPILFGAVGAVVPDLENLLWKTGIIDEKHKVFPTHSGLIRHGQARVGSGPAGAILMSAVSVCVVALVVVLGGSK
ncbi:hypothetical protein ACFL2Z_01680 [Candidatus Eisenbacteria bacterium]|uniref:Metal-dependent hydrolase n=1 Tax=Eiseniibacteriota bacterium TaxID=2212470 RepID=A0ABV6YNF5_UNCEI